MPPQVENDHVALFSRMAEVFLVWAFQERMEYGSIHVSFWNWLQHQSQSYYMFMFSLRGVKIFLCKRLVAEILCVLYRGVSSLLSPAFVKILHSPGCMPASIGNEALSNMMQFKVPNECKVLSTCQEGKKTSKWAHDITEWLLSHPLKLSVDYSGTSQVWHFVVCWFYFQRHRHYSLLSSNSSATDYYEWQENTCVLCLGTFMNFHYTCAARLALKFTEQCNAIY